MSTATSTAKMLVAILREGAGVQVGGSVLQDVFIINHETVEAAPVLQLKAVLRPVLRNHEVRQWNFPVLWSDRNPHGYFQSPPTFKPECKGGCGSL